MAQHRSEWRPFTYPMKFYIRYWQNRWYAFWKPALIRQTRGLRRKAADWIRKITVR